MGSVPAGRWSLKARYVFPVEGPPVADGVVTIDGERIVAAGAPSEIASPGPVTDLGNVAVLPGLVNAHTHLEFSDLRTPLGHPGQAFPDWIDEITTHRRGLGEEACAPVPAGLSEAVGSGTALLGEIAQPSWQADYFQRAPCETVVFYELIALARQRMEEQLDAARRHLLLRPSGQWTAGLSPHAPYSLHWELYRRLIDLAAEHDAPVAFHLAESPEELELLRTGGGPFQRQLINLGVWCDDAIPRGSRPLDYLRVLARAPRSLIVHGNYLDDEEIAFVAEQRARMAVVYCPRTHAYFQHAPHPLPKLLAAGVTVALGTDSRASNPDLNLLAEIRHVARHVELPPATVLQLGTLGGATALGRAGDVGSLAPGKWANLAIVPLPNAEAADPYELLFDGDLPVTRTMVRGRWVCDGET